MITLGKQEAPPGYQTPSNATVKGDSSDLISPTDNFHNNISNRADGPQYN